MNLLGNAYGLYNLFFNTIIFFYKNGINNKKSNYYFPVIIISKIYHVTLIISGIYYVTLIIALFGFIVTHNLPNMANSSVIESFLAKQNMLSFGEALVILQCDNWFVGKTNATHTRYVDITATDISKVAKQDYTQVDIDTMNKISDKTQITCDMLNQNPGLLAAFIFSIKSNIAVFHVFCNVIKFLRGHNINPEQLPAIKKVFIAHVSWLLANCGTPASLTNVDYDPLVSAIISTSNDKLMVPTFNDIIDDNSAYFNAFINTIISEKSEHVSEGLRMDADRFEHYISLC